MILSDSTVVEVALLIVRIGLGLTLAAHGYNKFYGGGRIPGTAGWFGSIGMKPGKFHAYMAAYAEVLSGIFLAIGLFTTFAAAGFVAMMLVAALLVHRKDGFFIAAGGWEYNFILALVPVVVAMLGPGPLSIDHILEFGSGDEIVRLSEYLDGWVGLAISAGAGVLLPLVYLGIFYRPPKEAEQD